MPRNDYLERILKARVYDVAMETPLEPARALSERLQNRVLIKREDLQPVFSFKLRGAYNKMAALPRARLARGVIAASAGNHAQGVALAAQRLGCRATIVMPVTTPRIKVDAVRARGAQVRLHGDSYTEAYAEALRLRRRRALTFVHPYDDPEVIAGQGTIGLEILRQHPGEIDAIFVPVGGGGLISGIAAYVKRVRASVRVIGVEPADADAMTRSLKAGRRVKLDHVGLFADGVAGKEVGHETLRLYRELVDEMVLVDTDEMCAAIKDVFEDTRVVL
ncbi:MAG TPA: threonine ammonia-lyase, biosynthetic, partial [Burkholderiales bacterium]|nr:threonine ammonia-lyase, biosynthetic [Burkholderiales bacterium]